MNKETKFRIWCITTKHFTDIPFVSSSGRQLLWLHTKNQVSISNVVDAGNYVIQQYTNIKDNNGTPIYEGDIVKIRSFDDWFDETGFDVIYQVDWCNYHNGWRGFNSSMIKHKLAGIGLSQPIEVVGNIMQNKDLIK